jgi:hypothetical protein
MIVSISVTSSEGLVPYGEMTVRSLVTALIVRNDSKEYICWYVDECREFSYWQLRLDFFEREDISKEFRYWELGPASVGTDGCIEFSSWVHRPVFIGRDDAKTLSVQRVCDIQKTYCEIIIFIQYNTGWTGKLIFYYSCYFARNCLLSADISFPLVRFCRFIWEIYIIASEYDLNNWLNNSV